MLDILKLHQSKDNKDARSWILANGKNLRKEINSLKSELFTLISKYDLTNFLCQKTDVKLRIKLDNLSVKEWLSQLEESRIKNNISFKRIMRISGTSGEDWAKIQKGEHLPSCRKLSRLAKYIDFNIFSNCKNKDFCLRSIDTITKSLDSGWIPLVVISGIVELYEKLFHKKENVKEHLINSIEKLKLLQYNSRSIKAVKEIDVNLAKILGAFAADGNYYLPDMLRWEDEYKEQLDILSEWFRKSFGLKLKIKPSNRGNSFTTKFRNKIIGRYFEVFFGYKPVSKTYSVDESILVKRSPLEVRKAFASGALMFDGSVNLDGTVNFSVASKKFRDSVAEILEKDGVRLMMSPKKSGNNWYFYTSRKLDLSQLNKLKSYFDKRIKKRHIIEFYLGNSKYNLQELFPKIKNKIKPLALLKFLDKTQNIYSLMRTTKLSRQTLLRYLRVLEQAKLINSQLNKGIRVYSRNNSSTNFELSKVTKSI